MKKWLISGIVAIGLTGCGGSDGDGGEGGMEETHLGGEMLSAVNVILPKSLIESFVGGASLLAHHTCLSEKSCAIHLSSIGK